MIQTSKSKHTISIHIDAAPNLVSDRLVCNGEVRRLRADERLNLLALALFVVALLLCLLLIGEELVSERHRLLAARLSHARRYRFHWNARDVLNKGIEDTVKVIGLIRLMSMK